MGVVSTRGDFFIKGKQQARDLSLGAVGASAAVASSAGGMKYAKSSGELDGKGYYASSYGASGAAKSRLSEVTGAGLSFGEQEKAGARGLGAQLMAAREEERAESSKNTNLFATAVAGVARAGALPSGHVNGAGVPFARKSSPPSPRFPPSHAALKYAKAPPQPAAPPPPPFYGAAQWHPAYAPFAPPGYAPPPPPGMYGWAAPGYAPPGYGWAAPPHAPPLALPHPPPHAPPGASGAPAWAPHAPPGAPAWAPHAPPGAPAWAPPGYAPPGYAWTAPPHPPPQAPPHASAWAPPGASGAPGAPPTGASGGAAEQPADVTLLEDGDSPAKAPPPGEAAAPPLRGRASASAASPRAPPARAAVPRKHAAAPPTRGATDADADAAAEADAEAAPPAARATGPSALAAAAPARAAASTAVEGGGGRGGKRHRGVPSVSQTCCHLADTECVQVWSIEQDFLKHVKTVHKVPADTAPMLWLRACDKAGCRFSA
jgi:hypothetical protein